MTTHARWRLEDDKGLGVPSCSLRLEGGQLLIRYPELSLPLLLIPGLSLEPDKTSIALDIKRPRLLAVSED